MPEARLQRTRDAYGEAMDALDEAERRMWAHYINSTIARLDIDFGYVPTLADSTGQSTEDAD
jgi:hypothetical protein